MNVIKTKLNFQFL